MPTTLRQRPQSERASKFVQEALLSPSQTSDVILTPHQPKQDSKGVTHAHADTGHADTGHADY